MKKISTWIDSEGNLWQRTVNGNSIEEMLLGQVEEPKKKSKKVVKKEEEEETDGNELSEGE